MISDWILLCSRLCTQPKTICRNQIIFAHKLSRERERQRERERNNSTGTKTKSHIHRRNSSKNNQIFWKRLKSSEQFTCFRWACFAHYFHMRAKRAIIMWSFVRLLRLLCAFFGPYSNYADHCVCASCVYFFSAEICIHFIFCMDTSYRGSLTVQKK